MARPVAVDSRRDLIILENGPMAIEFAAKHWVQQAREAINRRGSFYVALSGGSTPKAIYGELSQPALSNEVDWSCVHLFWSDERAVPPDHPESNYHMAMEAGLRKLSIPSHQIHRMEAETSIETHAKEYEQLIQQDMGGSLFDLVMLGVGEDGHTASLFPHTKALEMDETSGPLIVANFVPKLNSWRMSFTFRAINESRLAVFYAIGAAKQAILQKVLLEKEGDEPSRRVGTSQHRALWITDQSLYSR